MVSTGKVRGIDIDMAPPTSQVRQETKPGGSPLRSRRLSYWSGPVRGGQWGVLIVALGLIIGLHFFVGTQLIHQTNQDRMASDQQHNITLSKRQADDLWPRYTDGVVNPLWPWVAARFAHEDDETFFQRGKWLNLVLTALFLAGLSLWLARRWPLAAVIGLAAVGGLGALLPRAVYFQPEPLYYIFFFLTWATGLSLLFRNPWTLYPVFGAVAGLAYLAKSSVVPLILVFILVSGVRLFQQVVAPRLAPAGMRDWSWRRHLAGLILFAAAYLAVVGPRAYDAWERFGDPFHSWPKYWMWHESFSDESVPFMVHHGSREKLAALGPDEKPSFGLYVQTHGWERFFERLSGGTRDAVTRFFHPEGQWERRLAYRPWEQPLLFRGLYLAAPFALALVLFLLVRKDRRPWLETAFGLMFAGGALAVYALSYGWYEVIGRGDRFMLSLYLPLLFTGFVAVEKVRRRGGNARVRLVWLGAMTLFLATLVWRYAELVVYPEFK